MTEQGNIPDNQPDIARIEGMPMPDDSAPCPWLGAAAMADEPRKSPIEVDVEMLRSDRQDLLAQIAQTDKSGPEYERLRAELNQITNLLLAAEADLIDERPSPPEEGS